MKRNKIIKPQQLVELSDRKIVIITSSTFDTILHMHSDIFDKLSYVVVKVPKTPYLTDVILQQLDEQLHKIDFNTILGIGGGVVMDAAKMLATYHMIEYDIPLILYSTNASSGAEETSFAVVYDDEQNKSSESTVYADYIVEDVEILSTLTYDQKRIGYCDVLAQLLESNWTTNSITNVQEAVKIFYAITRMIALSSKWIRKSYNNKIANKIIDYSQLSGSVIDTTKTSIAHAFSYAFTSTFDVQHGEAVMLTLPFFNRIAKKKGLPHVSTTKLSKFAAAYVENAPWMTYDTFIDKIYNKVNAERLSTSKITLDDFKPQELYRYLMSAQTRAMRHHKRHQEYK